MKIINDLLLNARGRNHIKVMPLSDSGIELPTTEAEQIAWADHTFTNLQCNPDATCSSFVRNRKKGYQITVWSLGALSYLVLCLRSPSGTYSVTVYIGKERGDMEAISSFLKDNIDSILSEASSMMKPRILPKA